MLKKCKNILTNSEKVINSFSRISEKKLKTPVSPLTPTGKLVYNLS